MTIRIGTSGWVYKHWRGIFYPKELPSSQWFNYYAREFDTVEINNSFYRLPSSETFDEWREQAPSNFIYSVKASRYLTHLKRLTDPEDPLQRFFDRATHLRHSLGPILYQLPPRWHVNLARLEHFLSVLPKGYTHVVEFRDQTWFIEEVFQVLERYNIAYCVHDMRPLQVPLRVTSKTVYLRFHGNISHDGDYTASQLKKWAERITKWESEGRDIFVYFNNDPHGHAIKDARELKKLVRL